MATRNTPKTTKETTQEEVVEAVENATENKPVKVSNTRKKKKLPADTLVECKNITMGKLIYISKKQNGYEIIWSNPGDIEEIELGELMSMRNSQPRFFTQNWIGIEDEDILRYLGVEKYYEGVPSFDDYDDIFTKPLDELKEIIAKMPKGIKETLSFKASELINYGTIDSMKTIKYLCEAFGLVIEE